MFDSCICVDPDEVGQLLRRTQQLARKVHRCVECGHDIQPGQVYGKDVTLSDGAFEVYKTCLLCLRIRDSLFNCGWYYGMMWENIHEAYCGYGDDEFCICPDRPPTRKART